MSRVIVKNIPNYLNEVRVKELFSPLGEITDIKIAKKGTKSRKFCFVGFKNEDAGQKAIANFNNTFIDTSKIQVDVARTKDDPELPRAWSRHTTGTSAYNKQHKVSEEPKKKKKDLKSEDSEENGVKNEKLEEKKKKFLEYVTVMKGSKQSWNDDISKIKPKDEKKKNDKNSKSEEKKSQPVKTLEDQPLVIPIKPSQLKKVDPEKEKINKMYEDEVEGGPTLSLRDKIILEREQLKKEMGDKELPVDLKRLHVLNLPFNITEDEIKGIFSKFGQVTEIKIIRDIKGVSKGFGFVGFLTEEAAMLAFSDLDNKIVMGRILHIKPAYAQKRALFEDINKERQQKKLAEEVFSNDKSSYKKKKRSELMKRLEDDTNWNTLFLNPNTIVAEITERFKIKKDDILGQDANNQAVKIALAETQIINETKDWLRDNGLNIDVFTTDRKTCDRSKTVILVKNIPYATTLEQLHELFARYGAVYKVHLPPTKAVGIIEFAEQAHAENAFKSLSYYEFKEEPLYLEWAPLGLIDENKEKEIEEQKELNEQKSRTLFVKNLNFDTAEDTLKQAFEKENLGKFSVKIVKRPNKLSAGFGFIEFELVENAQKALKRMQNAIIDNHAIHISISNPVKQDTKPEKKRKLNKVDLMATNKLIIRNIPFEATRNEIRDLFKNFGEVKSVRLPKKIDGQHRGFAFIEFVSVEEAKNAYNSVGSTHLYGRKLNLEFSQEADQGEDSVNKKTKTEND